MNEDDPIIPRWWFPVAVAIAVFVIAVSWITIAPPPDDQAPARTEQEACYAP